MVGMWFFFMGYGIGYRMAQKFFENGFDLEKSLKCTADDLLKLKIFKAKP